MMIPPKLKKGDGVRVITPSRSLSMPWIDDEVQQIANSRFADLGLELSFGKHVHEMDEFLSSSVESRVADIHAAFSDPTVKMVITVIGGFNSNQILRSLDYDLITANPKIFLGFSDITALANAIHAKTGLVTYSGPHYFNFGEKKGFDYTLDHFKKCLMSDEAFSVSASDSWSSDRWAGKQDERNFKKNEGFWILNKGSASGKIVGGNMCTFNLLHGTEYMPDISDSILFLEDCVEAGDTTVLNFDRDLQSVIHQPGFETVRGLVIGRFEGEAQMTREKLVAIIASKKELAGIPVVANVDFGHTSPQITFPIGGKARLEVGDAVVLEILEH